MNEQLLKAIKGLKNFTVEDLELITGYDESEILEVMKELPVKSSGNVFVFEKEQVIQDKNHSHEEPDTKILKLLQFTEEEWKVYNSAPESVRKRGDIYLRIIRLTRGAGGKKLKDFIRYWNSKYPDKKSSASSVMRAKKKLKEEGLLSLLTIYSVYNKGKSMVKEDMYSMFKDLYLCKTAPTATSCYEKVKQEFINSIEEWMFPSCHRFLARLKSEFTQKEIKSFRKKL